MTERRHNATASHRHRAGDKKTKRGQKAVVNKYQQIPQSMISNNRPTFQQLEKAQSISSLSDRQVSLAERENDRTMQHIRQHY
jgi:hypothetical protein